MKYLMGLVLMLGALAAVQAQSDQPRVSARFERSTVFEGDSAVLRLELTGARIDGQPDLSPLEDDFIIGDMGTSSSMRITNDVREFSTEWSVLLEPKRTGELRVPPLVVGNWTTQPLTLTVMERPAGTGPDGREVFIEVDVQPRDPYVNAQVSYIIRLYHAPAIMEGSLGQPDAPEAVVERLGDDVDYRTTVDGRNYRVIERRFALFPERSGTMEIPPIRFQGRVADGNRARGFNNLFSRGRLTQVRSEPVTLEVRPRPDGFAGNEWIPAADLSLSEEWPNGSPEFRVGEPVTREITLAVTGQMAAQLPELEIPVPEGAKVYPDQPSTRSQSDGSAFVSRRVERFAIVPTEPGTLTLPELRVVWWDTRKDEERVAVLPAREFEVKPGLAGAVRQVPVPGDAATGKVAAEGAGSLDGRWRLAALAALVLWLVTLLGWLLDRRRRGRIQAPPAQETETASAAAAASLKALKACCREDDAAGAARVLRGLVGEDRDGGASLPALARRVEDPALAECLVDLDYRLYGGGDADSWQGDRLWQLCSRGIRLRPRERATGPSGPVPALYPES